MADGYSISADSDAPNETQRCDDDGDLGDEILGVHCRTDGYLASMGLSDHRKCSGWWQSAVINGRPVGFRCSCRCHDHVMGNL